MWNGTNQNQMGQGAPKAGNLDQHRQQNDNRKQDGQQGGFQHEPKPGANQQNKNPDRPAGLGSDQAQPKQDSRDENR